MSCLARVVAPCLMSCLLVLCHVMLCCVMLRHVMSGSATSRRSFRVVSGCVSFSRVLFGVSVRVLSCLLSLLFSRHVMSCHVMCCDVMSCNVVSCHVMSCRIASCRALLCRATLSFISSCPVTPVSSRVIMSCRVSTCRVISYLESLLGLAGGSEVLGEALLGELEELTLRVEHEDVRPLLCRREASVTCGKR